MIHGVGNPEAAYKFSQLDAEVLCPGKQGLVLVGAWLRKFWSSVPNESATYTH